MVQERISLLDVAIYIDDVLVGGMESATVTMTRENSAAHEGGNYDTAEIVDGAKSITGTLVKAMESTEVIRKICPPDAQRWPYFTLRGKVASGKPSNQRNVTVFNCKCDSFDVHGLELTGWAKNNIPFKALSMKFD